jgi:CelD/BcsL family acetyltransferase involved in cellulose biosynthesis
VDPDVLPRPTPSPDVDTLEYIETARVSIGGTFDEYWARRGKNLRHNLKRQRNQLAKAGIECRVRAITTVTDVQAAIAGYSHLESSGWKSTTGTAVCVDNVQGRFYRELMEEHCSAGHGRIYQFWCGDKLAATDLCIDHEGTFVVLKTTYDESMTTISPALLMREEYFRDIFNEGFARVEFYGKVMDWHRKWTDEIRTMYHLNTCRSQTLASLRRTCRATVASMAGLFRDRPAQQAESPTPLV